MSQVLHRQQSSTSFAARARAQFPRDTSPPGMMRRSRSMDTTAVLMVPIYDERHHGADLLMIPVPEEEEEQQQQRQDRRDTPNRPPTPPPKPQLPLDCEDWDDYLSWRRTAEAACKSSPALLLEREVAYHHHHHNNNNNDNNYRNRHHQYKRPTAAEETARRHGMMPTAPKEEILRGFEEWKDYLAQTRTANKRAAATRPVSIISTASTMTTATTATTATTSTTDRRLKRSSMCSISSTKSGKPRSLRRCSRSRHLRAYYSEGSLSTARHEQRDGSSPSLKDAVVHIEHVPRGRPQVQRQFISRQSLRASWVSTSCGPPPHPPPDKPLPALPMIVEPLQGERKTRKRNRSILDERERKRFHPVYWH